MSAERHLTWQRDTLAAGYERFLQTANPTDRAALARAALDLQDFEGAARQQIKAFETQPASGPAVELKARTLAAAQAMLEAIRQLQCYVLSGGQREDCRQAAEDAYDRYQGRWQDALDLLLRHYAAQGLPTPTPQPSYFDRMVPALESLRTASAMVDLVLAAQKGGGVSNQEVCRLRQLEAAFKQVPATLGQLVPAADLRPAHGKLLGWAEQYEKGMASIARYCLSKTPAQTDLDRAREEVLKGSTNREEAENLLGAFPEVPPRLL